MKRLLLLIFITALGAMAWGQIKPPDKPIIPEEYDPAEFPQWAHDIRRFEVIAFGSFPVTYFLSSLIYDITILAINNGSPEYELGSQRGEDDLAIIIGAAGIVSVGIATADLIITLIKRNSSKQSED
ncbi:MAG: hypothetical protein B0D92_03705 [Spirochaeta sp. LUC14_002_19_P3]|nr:MAG: hypothetical protein B0D92_03705 [Spirochaeta sp. LUC14_002_19_P3]